MKLNDLSVEDQELVLAFVEIATSECAGRAWTEIEPVLSTNAITEQRRVGKPLPRTSAICAIEATELVRNRGSL